MAKVASLELHYYGKMHWSTAQESRVLFDLISFIYHSGAAECHLKNK